MEESFSTSPQSEGFGYEHELSVVTRRIRGKYPLLHDYRVEYVCVHMRSSDGKWMITGTKAYSICTVIPLAAILFLLLLGTPAIYI